MAETHEDQGGRGELSPNDVARLSDQIAGVTRSGLPLGPGLRALGEEMPRGRFRDSLERLADAIDRGTPLDTAIKDQKDRIPPHLRGLVEGGLRTGKLGDVLGRFSTYASISTDLKRGLWLGLAYPLLTLTVALTLFLLIDVFMVAQFENIFRDFGVPLPLMTVFMVETSHAIRAGWPFFATLLVIIGVAWFILRFVVKREKRNSLIGRLPIIGPLWRFSAWAEFCHLLALLLESELPMPEALRLTGRGVQNTDIDLACRAMAEDVEQGMSLSNAMAGRVPKAEPAGPFDHLVKKETPPASPEAPRPRPVMAQLIGRIKSAAAIKRAMPHGLPSLLRWAEDHSTIAEILHMAGEMFQARSRNQAMFAGTVMGVAAVIGVIIGVFTVVVGLMLPLLTLLTKLSG